MSSNASAGARESTPDYDWLLDQLDGAIAEAHRKVESGRVYDAENEKVRIKWIRALAYAVNVRRQITNDRTLEELSERIGEIERQQNP
jgi:hypothetical protein